MKSAAAGTKMKWKSTPWNARSLFSHCSQDASSQNRSWSHHSISQDYAHSPGKVFVCLFVCSLVGRIKYKICIILPNYLKIIPPVHLDISNNLFISCILFINEEFQFLGKMARLVNGKIEQQKPIFEWKQRGNWIAGPPIGYSDFSIFLNNLALIWNLQNECSVVDKTHFPTTF